MRPARDIKAMVASARKDSGESRHKDVARQLAKLRALSEQDQEVVAALRVRLVR